MSGDSGGDGTPGLADGGNGGSHMAGANAACASARAGTILGVTRSTACPTHRRLGRAEPWLRRTVPVVLVAVLFALAAATCIHAYVSRSDILRDASDDIDVLATMAALRLDAPLADRSGAELQLAALARSLPGSAFGRGRTVILADGSGAVLAAYPRVDFECGIVRSFVDGLADRPATAFGTFNADLL